MIKHLLYIALLTSTVSLACAQELSFDTHQRGLSFIPDFSFKGSSLKGWHPLGSASWQAHNGEISAGKTGTGKTDTGATATGAAGAASWLVLNRSFQDVDVQLEMKVAPGAEGGLLVRMEKTADGYKGILVSVKDSEAVTSQITLDQQGKETSRVQLRTAGNIIRVAPKPPANPAEGNSGQRRGRNGMGRTGPADLPILPVSNAIVTDGWNQYDVVIDFDIIRKKINDGNDFTGAATDDLAEQGGQGYGPIALYAGGNGRVQFRNIYYKDAHVLYTPIEASSSRYKPQRINDMFYSFSAAAADFNRDGHTDIVAGPYIYWGPDYTHYQEIFFAETLKPSREFPVVNCQYAYDFNGDGWPDVLVGAATTTLYLNPKGESRRWDSYKIIPGGVSEVTTLRDIDGDGRPELVYAANGALWYAKFDPADPTKPWVQHQVSGKGYYQAHGIGVGDINGDGRMDIINPYGWWEQPAKGQDTGQWIYHPQAFSRSAHWINFLGGCIMAVYDVNGDGLNDVVTALNAHGFGLAWFEQKRDKAGKITFTPHMIMDDYLHADSNAGGVTFSELHGTNFADLNGDGLPDFIAGKRYWSHLDSYFDPDPYGPAVLYAFITVRDKNAPGGARFVPELIHNRSGAGSDVTVADLDKDGAIDVIVSGDRGTYIFWNQTKARQKAKARPSDARVPGKK